ncbi:MAG: hypothetical protein NVSMB57_01470 [Actinomycetota bacterium]
MVKMREVGNFIRDQRRTASLSLRKLSTLAGVSNPYLSQIERGLRRPSAEILKEIAKALSISAETLYIKAGILDERTDDADVVGNVRRDQTISEKQKQILVDLYQSFKAPTPPTARSNASSPRKRAKAKPPARKTVPRKATAAKTAPKAPPTKKAKPRSASRPTARKTSARRKAGS